MIFGFKDNKCKGKVYTQDEVDNLLAAKSGTGHTHAEYKVNGDFAILTGTITLEQVTDETDNSNTGIEGTIQISYPEGFTIENSVCIAVGISQSTSSSEIQYSFQNMDDTSASYMVGAIRRRVSLRTSDIALEVGYYPGVSPDTQTRNYKIVLMKI